MKHPKKLNLLAIDWDFFFPMPPYNSLEYVRDYDWGSKEALFFVTTVWQARAAVFLQHNPPVLPGTSGVEDGFWSKIHLVPDAEVFISESDAMTGTSLVRRDVGQVVLMDAHHDSGYNGSLRQKELTCDNWMRQYQAAKRLLIYPHWRPSEDVGTPDQAITTVQWGDPVAEYTLQNTVFDRVHIARSGAWTPPWNDEKLVQFIEACPSRLRFDMDEHSTHGLSAMIPRFFSREAIEAQIKVWKDAVAQLEEMRAGRTD